MEGITMYSIKVKCDRKQNDNNLNFSVYVFLCGIIRFIHHFTISTEWGHRNKLQKIDEKKINKKNCYRLTNWDIPWLVLYGCQLEIQLINHEYWKKQTTTVYQHAPSILPVDWAIFRRRNYHQSAINRLIFIVILRRLNWYIRWIGKLSKLIEVGMVCLFCVVEIWTVEIFQSE